MSDPRNRWRLLLLAPITLLAVAGFALGIGVKGLLDGDEPAMGSVRALRGGGSGPAVIDFAASDARDSRFSLLDEVYDILSREFVEPDRVELGGLRTAAINGAIASLNDPHSVYIDRETFHLSSESISGQFEGIGATVDQQSEGIFITGTFRGSPAEAAGIRSGDLILAVNGESTEGWPVQLAVARIRGPAGTDVVLTVRHRTGQEEEITVKRGVIVIPSVQAIQVEDAAGIAVEDLAYIAISQFTENTRAELVAVLEGVQSAQVDGLIIDLRGNPGGLLSATVEVTGEFLDGGVVLTEVNRNGDEQAFNDQAGGGALEIPLVILVNGGSASGSEVFAAALRDYGRAVIVGEQTLGKGTVSIPRHLSDGSVLYVSTARWLTPDRDLIEGIGLIPDFIIEPSDIDFEQRRDVQLFAAINYLRGLPIETPLATPQGAPEESESTEP